MVCEGFRCLPSQAEAELNDNAELVFDILDLWNYRDAYFRNKSIEQMKDIKARNRARAGDVAVAEVVANDFALNHPDRGERDGHD